MTTPAKKKTKKRGLGFDDVRALALALPGVEEGTSYGTPALKAAGKLIARLREDGETLVVRIEDDARDLLLRSDPETFFMTDHYVGHPWVLVRLPRVERAALALLLEEAVRLMTPKRGARSKPQSVKPQAVKAKPATSSSPVARRGGKLATLALSRARRICLALPDATEQVSHGAPVWQVRGKTFAMFADNHHGDGRVALWIKAPPGAQAMLVGADARRFFVPPYVGPRGWVGARLDLEPHWEAVAACLEDGWRTAAPQRVSARQGRTSR
jgi:hypothetical protein